MLRILSHLTNRLEKKGALGTTRFRKSRKAGAGGTLHAWEIV